MNEEWLGVETIIGLVGEPPTEIKIPYKLQKNQQRLLKEWNPLFIAIIPYCFKCKEPLVWHHKPVDGVLFHCPKCKRQWIKDESWEKADEPKK